MNVSRRGLMGAGVALPALSSLSACAPLPDGSAGPFRADWDSLIGGYRTPDWFRDAKFGIWSHWGPQCVPEFGDWYGRQMYIQGNPFYDHHLANYGHPSRTGFLDIIGRWKGEAWDPEGLLDLFQAAGARYIVSMANHHDNLDMFPTEIHGWNTTRVGPMRDIVGTWEKAVRARGLRFGVSNHGAHAWHWWQTAYGYDAEGPMKGIRYDAARLTRADGAGTWWEGLDPQELYTGPTFAPPDGINTIAEMNAWHDARDGQWIEEPPANNPAFVRSWVARQRELITRYRPDMVYFDNYGLPLGRYGLEATAEFYNASLAWRGELPVVNGKRLEPRQRKGITETVERGFSDSLRPEPWQTDTCIGDWHYNRARFTSHYYVPAESVIQRLVDVVSKNGNLLLNIPQRGDGTIDADEHAILTGIAAWMRINGEAIFETRPWRIYGEGPTEVAAGMHGEGQARPWTGADIRFTTRSDALYAFALAWPGDGRMTIRSLASGTAGTVERVELLGGGPLPFRQTNDALVIELPQGRPVMTAPAVRLRGSGLV
ncbi:alpha-L-fucosidase [Rhizobium sp. CRIBSB]|nr:alpha-L-fucosidase [Rhizobium sp. CRIBSB]